MKKNHKIATQKLLSMTKNLMVRRRLAMHFLYTLRLYVKYILYH